MNKNYYITTTLPYVNADPHLGHALEFVQADVFSRAKRREGYEVTFNTGTDEHGQKVFEAANRAGQDVQEYVDYYASQFEKVKRALDLSNDRFIRTTSSNHILAAEEMWRRCHAAGDIYKKEFEGLYCVGCEKYLTERDMQEGVCMIHGKAPIPLKEENYFFRFSKYQDRLLDYLKKAASIAPEWRRDEAIKFVEGGLDDFSISREKVKLSWGIPVPGDETQVMYVWFDALTNYISTLGWPNEEGDFRKFWKEGFVLQMAGKDQIRFQSLMWQAMLMSANVKNSDRIFYHGFITSDGKKMSKSLGNVIGPFDLVEKYGTDATRYLLLRHVHPFEDSDVTWDRLDEWYNAGLVNGLGNLVSRVMKMVESYGVEWASQEIPEFPGEIVHSLEQFDFKSATDFIWDKVSSLDRRIQETEPFKLIKTDPEKAKEILRELVSGVYEVGTWLAPFLPKTSEIILAAVRAGKKPENLFSRK